MSVVNTQGNSAGIQPANGGVDAFSLKNSHQGQSSIPKQQAVPAGGASAQASTEVLPSKGQGGTTTDSKPLDQQQQQVSDALDKILKKLEPKPKTLQFSVNRQLDQIVVKVVDMQSRKVVYQIPSEAILKMSEQLQSLDTKKIPVGSLLSEQA